MPETNSDQRLMARFRSGDQSAFRELVVRHAPLVLATCRRILYDRHAAEDAFQATFAALAQNAESVRGSTYAPWLHGVAYRIALRMRARRQRQQSVEGARRETETMELSPLSLVQRRHDLEVMDEELQKLPNRFREPLVLHYLQGKSHEDISRILQLPKSTIKGRMQRARHQLRVRLTARGVSLASVVVALTAQLTEVSAADQSQLIDSTIAGLHRSPVETVGTEPAEKLWKSVEKETAVQSTYRFASFAACVSLCGVLFWTMTPGDFQQGANAEVQSVSVSDVGPHESTDVLFVAQVTSQANRLLLSHGDGQPDGRKSIAGSAEMVQFTLPSDTQKLKAIKIHGSRYGYPQPPKEDIEILILNEDMSEVLHRESAPYALFKRGKAKWNVVRFKKPLEVPNQFWVAVNFNAERTKGVYVSYDTSTGGEHSRVGLPPEVPAKKTDFEGDWMIQALVTPPSSQ